MRYTTVVSSALVSFMLTGLMIAPVFAPPISFTTGWDVFTVAPGPGTNVIVVHPNSLPMLNIAYNLNLPSVPSTTHRVGFHLFWPSTSSCVLTFGTLGGGTLFHSNCDTATRQGQTHVFESFELGDIALDSFGVGSLSVTIGSIPSGTYVLELDVRVAACSFCDVILQAPGPVYSLSLIHI